MCGVDASTLMKVMGKVMGKVVMTVVMIAIVVMIAVVRVVMWIRTRDVIRIDVGSDGNGDADLMGVMDLFVGGFGIVNVEVDVFDHFGCFDFGRWLKHVDSNL
uniref:Transmembrane protein n=1 Tax=Cacopsylla melanoneura TaxID=428564 RepID=A0A8D8TTF9_9HEMI